jgi:hypothetical protein
MKIHSINPAPPRRSHQWIDARSLALKRLIADRIRERPELFERAVETLEHWKRIKQPPPRALLEWDEIFKLHSREEILEILIESGERGQWLRQCDPFCGILTEVERQQFLLDYETR